MTAGRRRNVGRQDVDHLVWAGVGHITGSFRPCAEGCPAGGNRELVVGSSAPLAGHQ